MDNVHYHALACHRSDKQRAEKYYYLNLECSQQNKIKGSVMGARYIIGERR